ncbi:hypothetical protein BGZ81_009812 [Podila clonocystis]|nr:hypothetical protein BGZ81_009812 [Podila clonocystis]
MTNNPLTLFCLADGNPTSNAFSIKIPTNDTIHDLKKLIKAEKTNDFSDVDADKLTLWRVSIPIDDDNEIPIWLDSLTDKKKLLPRTYISVLFTDGLPDEFTYILVQRPQPVHTLIPARASTPLPGHLSDGSRTGSLLSAAPIIKRSVPYDNIENELAQIIEDANRHHSWHTISATDVETAQKDMLGPFYKKTMPYGTTASSMNLAMLGMVLDKEPTSSDNRTLRGIVESDIGKTTDLSVVAMVGRSGSGKTATVIDLARRHFVVYCVCSNPRSRGHPDFKDRNFSALAKDVEQMCLELPIPNSSKQRMDNDSRLKKLAGDRVELEFLARLLFLQLLFYKNTQLTSEHFFREQTNGGAVTIGTLVEKLRVFESSTIRSMLNTTQDRLAEHLIRRGQGLVVALDEAQIAGGHILPREFISPTAAKTDEIFDGKGELKERYSRGFLMPLCATLGDVRATLVVLGTSLSLQDADHVYSAVGKRTNFHKIMQFPSFDHQDVEDVISKLIDTSGYMLPHVKCQKLIGRPRFSVSVVRELFELYHIDCHTKQTKLEKAFDSAIDRAKTELREKVQNLLGGDRTGEVAHLLGRMVLAFKLQGGKTWFASKAQVDFMDKALCSLRVHSDGVHWLMDEPLVVEVVEEELKKSNMDSDFSQHLRQLNEIIEHLGIELPTWCNGLKLQIDEINTARGFGYGAGDTAADLKFLIDRPSNPLLVQQSGTREDGAWFFSDHHYAGSLAVKFYSNAIPYKDHEENETSSDIRCSFLRADGTKENSSLKKIRDDFIVFGVPSEIKGIFRIHLEIPRVQGMQLATHVRRDPATGIEDVMVYISLSNMDDFSYEGIAENKRDAPHLKTLIKYVLAK